MTRIIAGNEYERAWVCFDDSPSVEAWVQVRRWNGWGCPLLTLAQVRELFAAPNFRETPTIVPQRESVVILWEDDSDEYPLTFDAVEVDGATLYNADTGLCFNVSYSNDGED